MRKLVLVMGICSVLGACEQYDVSLVCDGHDVDANLSANGEFMTAIIDGASYQLRLGVSASGARYLGRMNDGDVALWNKADTWLLFLNDGMAIECVAK